MGNTVHSFSVAVDFVKTGQRPEPFSRDLRPREFPDFMEKKDKQRYESISILGQLYREAKKFKVTANETQSANQKSFPYSSFVIAGYLSYIDEARTLKEEYDRECNNERMKQRAGSSILWVLVRRLMRHYGVRHETEILSGYMTKFMSRQHSKEGKLFELRNEIAHAIRVMRHKYDRSVLFRVGDFLLHLRYIQHFWQEFYLPSRSAESALEEQEPSARLWQTVSSQLTWHNQLECADFHQKHPTQVDQKGSAWFYVTYQERRKKKPAAENKREEFFSFAWLIYPVLFHIYDERGQKVQRRRHRRKNRGKN